MLSNRQNSTLTPFFDLNKQIWFVHIWFEICIFVIPSAVSWRGPRGSAPGGVWGGAPTGFEGTEPLVGFKRAKPFCGIPKGEALGGVWGGAPAGFQRAAPFG